MKTPIYIDFNKVYPNLLATNELKIYDEDPIDIYTDPTILDPLDTTNTQPYILAPRYYLEIHKPQNQPGPSIHIPIHKSPNSLLKDKVRVALKPSIGWGINASYKVEYWEWIPNINLPAIPSKKKITTEYWYVPTLDREYIPRFPFDHRCGWGYPYDQWDNIQRVIHPGLYNFFRPRRTSVVLEVERTVVGDTVEDLITDVSGLSMFYFPEGTYNSFTENIIQEALEFNDETKTWTFSKALVSSTLVRDSSTVDGGILDGTVQTTIEYIEPFHPEQLVFFDYNDILNDGLMTAPYFI